MPILDGLLGGAFGIAPHNFMNQQRPTEIHCLDSTIRAMQQQQSQRQGLSAMLGGYGYASLAGAAQQQEFAMNHPFDFKRKTKHVDSIDVTPRERARKQINGAVQAVKDAEIEAKDG